jgi:hypothetical protein
MADRLFSAQCCALSKQSEPVQTARQPRENRDFIPRPLESHRIDSKAISALIGLCIEPTTERVFEQF